MTIFPRCDDKLEAGVPPEVPEGLPVERRCDGTLVPIKIYPRMTGEWLIDWRCTKCGRTM